VKSTISRHESRQLERKREREKERKRERVREKTAIPRLGFYLLLTVVNYMAEYLLVGVGSRAS